MKEIKQEKNRPASNIPYQGVNKPFRTTFIVPGPGVAIEQDANGVCYISAEGGAGVSDLVAGDNIVLTRTDDGKIIISAVDTATNIAAGQNITIDIDPETGTAIINSITGGATNEHYKGVFDTAEDLIAFDTNPQVGDYGMIKNITYSDGGEITWNGQYKYCFYINGQWTVVDQMLTFTDDIELLQQFYSVGGSSPVIYLHKVAQTGSFLDLRDVPIVATPVLTVEGDTVTATCATEGAEIWYTTDGTMPHVNGNKYTVPITVTEATTFRFVGIKNGMINSLEATVGLDYELEPPTIDLDWHDGTITMDNPNQSGTIYYTTDGTTPTNASNVYTGPFVITERTRFKLAVISNGLTSDVVEQDYRKLKVMGGNRNMNPATGVINVSPGIIANESNVVVSGILKYTQDGNDPTFLSSDFVNAVSLQNYGGIKTIKEKAFAEGYVPSDTRSSNFGELKPVSPPVFFDSATNTVSLCDTNIPASNGMAARGIVNGLFGGTQGYVFYYPEGSTYSRIYYTLDGSTPTKQSTLYTGPFQITGNLTVKAVLIAYGQYYSDVTTENIVITNAPTISLNSDTGDISITGPAGSTLYYTRDGSKPTTESTQYTGTFNVENSSSITVKAIAVTNGQESAVAEETYPGLLLQWKGSAGGDIDYSVGKITKTPRTQADGATVFYDISASGYPSNWKPYDGKPVEINLFDDNNPREFLFRQTKPGWIPAWYGGVRVGYTTPDVPVIDYDDETGLATLLLDGNTYEIPLQTNENVPSMGARIYYTFDGSTPTAQNGSLYQDKPVPVPEGTTEIKAVTICYGEFESDVTTEDIAPEPSVDYMYFEAVEANSTVALTSTLATAPNLEYSTDGVTWQEWQHTTADDTHTFDTITLSDVGDRFYLRGDNPDGLADWPENSTGVGLFSHFEMSGKIAAGGNIMSLLDKDAEMTEIPVSGFTFLFGDVTTENPNTSLTAAAAMSSITTIRMHGCTGMYTGCTSLTAAAAMPALTSIVVRGCTGMYCGCTSLTAAAAMPSLTTIGYQGCSSMYRGCTSLTAAAAMPSLTTIGEQGCSSKYHGCTSLTAAAAMPSLTTIGKQGCENMYDGCTSLTAAADMPSLTTIRWYGCSRMYHTCTALTAAAAMPALTSIGGRGCYRMYYTCTFDMSDDGITLNFDFPTPPITTTGDTPETYATAYDVADWMGNTNGFTEP